MCGRKKGNFSLFEQWIIHRLEIAVSVHPSGIETVKVWALVMEDATSERVRDLLEELSRHLAGGHPTVKTCHLWVLDLDVRWYPIYGEDEAEAEYQAAIMERSCGQRISLLRAPQGRGEFSGAITMISPLTHSALIPSCPLHHSTNSLSDIRGFGIGRPSSSSASSSIAE